MSPTPTNSSFDVRSGDNNELTLESVQGLVQTEAQKAQAALQKEAKEIRKDFISVFGLFAAFLTFTVLQIQGFIQAHTMALIMGAAAFFVASSITFVIALQNILHGREEWKDFKKPIFVIAGALYIFSFVCFYYQVSTTEKRPETQIQAFEVK